MSSTSSASYPAPRSKGTGHGRPRGVFSEAPGCGAPGADVYLWFFRDGNYYISQDALPWPSAGEAVFDASFSGERPAGATGLNSVGDYIGGGVAGELRLSDGRPAPAGTVIEADVGDMLCGRFTVPPVVMVCSQPGLYNVSLGGAGNASCGDGRTASLLVNDQPTDVPVATAFTLQPQVIDLVVP